MKPNRFEIKLGVAYPCNAKGEQLGHFIVNSFEAFDSEDGNLVLWKDYEQVRDALGASNRFNNALIQRQKELEKQLVAEREANARLRQRVEAAKGFYLKEVEKGYGYIPAYKVDELDAAMKQEGCKP